MKAEIHPNYQPVQVACSCGNKFEVPSTLGKESLHLDICSNCHPFFTGSQRVVDSAGRIDKFKKKFGGRSAIGMAKNSTNTTDSKE